MLFKILFTLSFLIVASIKDLQHREVSNKLTILWVLAALAYAVYDCIEGGLNHILVIVASWVFITTLTNLLYELGWMGGADVKALVALTFLYPWNVILILMLALLLTFAAHKFKPFKNFPFMLSITGGFLLSLL